LVMDSAETMAASLLRESATRTDRIRRAYEQSIGRPPSASESNTAEAFITGILSDTLSNDADKRSNELIAWSLFCQSLLASNEFMYLR